MPTPDWREGDVLTALLDENAGLRDPMRVAAALDELQAGTRGAPGALHERVHAMLQPADEPAAARRVRRVRIARPRRLAPVLGLAAAAVAVAALGVVVAGGTTGSGTRIQDGAAPTSGLDAVTSPSATTQHGVALPPPRSFTASPPIPQAPATAGGATGVAPDRARLQRYQLWMEPKVRD